MGTRTCAARNLKIMRMRITGLGVFCLALFAVAVKLRALGNCKNKESQPEIIGLMHLFCWRLCLDPLLVINAYAEQPLDD